MKKKVESMSRILTVLVCFLIAAACLLAQKKAPTPIQLIETGSFHGDEIRARSGQQWLGLFHDRQVYALRQTVVTVKAVHDEVVDEEDKVKTGREVFVTDPIKPIFLLKGGEMLQSGPVTTVFNGNQSLTNNSDITLTLGGVRYRLRVLAKNPVSKESVLSDDAQLVLSRGAETQVLYKLSGKGESNDPNWSLRWAGDLDGDGQLDLYIEASDHYNITLRHLYLSSARSNGKFVKEIAQFFTTGC